MKDPLRQPVPIPTDIELEVLGYSSTATCITNPTKQWRREYLAIQEMVPNEAKDDAEAESEESFEQRKAEALYRLVPYVVSSVTLAHGKTSETFPIVTPADAKAVDEIDERVFELVIGEAYERGLMGVLNGRKTFRDERGELLVRSGTVPSKGS